MYVIIVQIAKTSPHPSKSQTHMFPDHPVNGRTISGLPVGLSIQALTSSFSLKGYFLHTISAYTLYQEKIKHNTKH